MNYDEMYDRLAGIDKMPQPTKPKANVPKGWEPGISWDGTKGTITTSTLSEPPSNWSALLQERGLDPDLYEIVGDTIRWTSYDGWKRDAPGDEAYSTICFSYKAEIRLKKPNEEVIDYEDLYKQVRKRKAVTGDKGDATLVVNLSDWQVGNALADDTPVLTPSGWVKHGEIRPGDYVYGPDGAPKKVLEVTGSSLQECYEVQFDRDVKIIASGDHLWQGWRRYKDHHGTYGRRPLTWTTEQIAALKPTIRDNRQYIERAFHVDIADAIELPEKYLLVDPYVLGAWLGDGKSDSGWISAAETDAHHWLAMEGTHQMPAKPHPTVVNIRFEGLSRNLRLIGVLGNKHVPEEYLCASRAQRLALLQGLMDTDGTINSSGQAWFDNTNESLADAAYWLVTSLGMKATRSYKQGRLNGVDKRLVYRVQFRPHIPVFRLQRKLERIAQPSDTSAYRFVQSVTPVGERSAQCLTVEGSLYLAGHDLVVTHNCDGGGTRTQIEALAALPELIVKRLKDLRKTGNKIDRVLLAGLGDLGEGTCGFYPSQPFLTQLDRRSQTRVVRRALVDIIQMVADNTTEVLVTAVGGNHGENRDGGKRQTGFADNDDVAVFEQVAEIFAASPYDNIAFRLPNDELGIAVDLHGQIVAFTHGHLPKPGQNAAQAVWNWWKDHAMGRFYPGVADADILVAGHFHHLNVKQQEKRTVFICPSLTPVGDWFSNSAGVQTVPGTLTFVVNERGWSQMEVLSHTSFV